MVVPILVGAAVFAEHGVSAGVLAFLLLFALGEIHDLIEEVRDMMKEGSNGGKS